MQLPTTALDLIQKEYDPKNQYIKLNESAATALKTYNLHNKSLMQEASSAVQKAMATIDSLGLLGGSAAQKIGRRGRNPQTGETITIEARRILTFKPSQVLKKAINL